MILVVGSTGLLGGAVCRQLRGQGREVRALVRPSSDPKKVEDLRALSIEVVSGDVRDAASLRKACEGADVVISTASAMVSRTTGDSIASVDLEGQLALIEAAEAARVSRFTYLSFPIQPFDYPLQAAKQAVEARLSGARLAHTIARPTFFTEVWLSPALWPFHGLHPGERRARFVGDGKKRTRWISFLDVAGLVSTLAVEGGSSSKTIDLAGPETLSMNEVAKLLESMTGQPLVLEATPEEAVRQQMEAVADPIQKSLAALMLACGSGDPPDFAATSNTLQGSQRVADHLKRLIQPNQEEPNGRN